MTRHLLWTLPALALATLAGLSCPRPVAAQAAVDSPADTTADTAADTAASETAAEGEPSSSDPTPTDAEEAGTSAEVQTATPPADVAPPTPADSDVQSSATPSIDATNTNQPADSTATGNAGVGVAAGVEAATQQPGVNVNGQATINAGASRVQQQADRGLQFGQATNRGLTVNTIDRQSYFYNGGLRRGDVIVSYNGRPIRTHDEWRRWVVFQPGQRVPVIVLRDGQRETIYVTYRVQQQPGPYFEQPATYPRSAAQAYLGIALDQSVNDAALVLSVNPGSPAEQAGLQPGDIIVALSGRGVSTWRDVPMIVSSMQAGDLLDITFTRRMENRAQATLGIRNVDAPVAVRVQPAVSADVQATYSVPSTPPTVDRAYQAGPVRPRDVEADGRVLDRDRPVDRGLRRRD